MGLYDQVNQTNTPFMSQFVGSIVPEVNSYAGNMQKRYDTAADSDDALGEALGNLQHLGLDSDTQYANELKNNYYQRLQERANSGDFENMGRRTRQDAIRFSQAYQPLMQRQKDYAEVVKKIQSDDKIADPATKQALIRQFQYNNTPKRNADGDFDRDGSGRIQLGAIQDAVYAPDVDINKKLLDELSKKEADIKAGKYFSNGRGELVNTIEKVRDPRYMAELAGQIQQSDPEIKAMINRDVNLQTYAMDPTDVKQNLKASGLDKSPYQQLRARGLNDHEIGNRVSKIAPLDAMKAQLMASGYSEEAAEKAILNNHLAQSIRDNHSGIVGGILGFKQESNEHMTDHMAVIRASAAANNIKDPNLMVVNGNTATTSQEDPLQTTKSYVEVKKDLQSTAQNAQTAIQAGLKATGMATGDPKKDISTAIELMHNPVKLNVLKLELAKTNPQEAQILETVAQSYQNKAAIAGVQESHINDVERAGKVDWDSMYKDYVKDKSGRSIRNVFDSKILSKEDFQDHVRSDHGGFMHALPGVIGALDYPLANASKTYEKGLTEGQKNMVDGTTQAEGYHTIVPTGPGKTAQLTDAVNDLALSNGLTGIDLNDPNKGQIDIAKSMGIDAANYQDKKTKAMEKGLGIKFNLESVNNKPTVTVNAADGTSKVFQVQNLPQSLQDEYHDQVIRAGLSANTTAYGKRLAAQGYAGLGSTAAPDITLQYAKQVNPGESGVVKRLNDEFSFKVTDAGGGLRRYTLLSNNPDGSTTTTSHKFDSADDLWNALGLSRYHSITTKSEQATMNNPR